MLLVFIESQGLVIADRKRHLLRDVWLKQLRAPPAMVDFDQLLDGVVQQAGQDDFL